jgi:SAM-dependent methyltransferase/GNAT superfamily N-acetyltransferase
MRRWTGQRALRRAAEVLREDGFKSLFFKVLGEAVYRRVVLFERPLDEPMIEVTSRLPVTIELLRESQVHEYCGFRPEAVPAEIQRRLAEGQQCFVVRHEGRLVHASWAAFQRARIDYLAREIRLAPDEVYDYESYTLPEFRGQNLSPARLAWMIRTFRAAGYRRLLLVVVPENKPAFRAGQKTGFHPIGWMGYVRIGPWRHDFCRVNGVSAPPGEPARVDDSTYWNGIGLQFGHSAHYLDPFLGHLKRQAYLEMMRRWEGMPGSGLVLKTDLFEEAMGPDAFLADLAGDQRTVIGMDLSPAITTQARRRDGDRRAEYVAADVRRLPFASNSFAAIISPSTLDHFSDPADLGRSLLDLGRILEPGGRLIVTVDNRQNIFDPLLRLVDHLRRVPYYLGYSYTVDELRAELTAAGLYVEDTTAILHNPRLVAVAAVSAANRLHWRPLVALVRRTLLAAQRLEKTRWRYRTGSFVAARAVRLPSGSKVEDDLPPNPQEGKK